MSAESAAGLLKALQAEELRALTAVELGMVSHEYTPFNQIVRYSSLNTDETTYRLRRLHHMGFVSRHSRPFLGYALNTSGYDCLALNALVKGDHLEALGKPLGIGKESDVYDALTPSGERVAVKFHRIGRTSFRQTKRRRVYIAGRTHISWLYESRLAAEREYEALKRLHVVGVAVPRPIAWNRHIVVMEIIIGAELSDYYELLRPAEILRDILTNLRKAYVEAQLVHADLSEYNVLIQPDSHIFLIDWPQCVGVDQVDSETYARRDVSNIINYFRRKFKVSFDPDVALRYVQGMTKILSGAPRRSSIRRRASVDNHLPLG